LRLDRQVRGWIGAALTLVGAVATLWLAATGKLNLGDLSNSALVYQLLALPDAGYVSLVAQLEDEQLRFSIVVLGQEESRTIYEPEPADSTIPLVCLSPNG
jgi:hypothetical protein